MKRTTTTLLVLSMSLFIGSHANAAGGSKGMMIGITLHDMTLHEIFQEFEGFPTMSHHMASLHDTLNAAIAKNRQDMSLPTNELVELLQETHRVAGTVKLLAKGKRSTCKELLLLYIPPIALSRSMQVLYFTSSKKRQPAEAFIPATRLDKLGATLMHLPFAFQQLKDIANGTHQHDVFARPLPHD